MAFYLGNCFFFTPIISGVMGPCLQLVGARPLCSPLNHEGTTMLFTNNCDHFFIFLLEDKKLSASESETWDQKGVDTLWVCPWHNPLFLNDSNFIMVLSCKQKSFQCILLDMFDLLKHNIDLGFKHQPSNTTRQDGNQTCPISDRSKEPRLCWRTPWCRLMLTRVDP